MEYIVSNGAGNHVDELVLPILRKYKRQFCRTTDYEREMDRLFAAAVNVLVCDWRPMSMAALECT